MQLTSTAFPSGGRLPERHACTGPGISPPLAWAYLPAGTVSLALIVDEPNPPGGALAHWVVYDLPPIPARLEEGAGTADGGPPGATQGRNDYGELGYGAACPPRGARRWAGPGSWPDG